MGRGDGSQVGKVIFTSNRPLERAENLKAVWDAYDGEKAYSQMLDGGTCHEAEHAEELGYSVGYKYPHDFPGHITGQQYMTDKTLGRTYYEPTDIGYEAKVRQYLDYVKKMTEGESDQ